MECVTCGGTEFIKESGFYYCVDCQTQSQEVREHVFQQEVTNVKSGRKIKTAKAEDKPDNKVSSWECYNIIMCGLTQELVNLGAKPNFKKIVRILWMKYLEKLEVVAFDKDMKPKFAAYNLKRDVNVVFNMKKKRKRKKSQKSDTDESSLDTTSFKRERTKKKQALAQAQYDEYSIRSTQETNTSVLNETLTSLKNSDKSEPELEISFNRYANKELQKRMSKDHVKLHSADISFTLNCHKLTSRASTKIYRYSVGVISPVKMYTILYLGLLINRDPIQLGDMLRFAREGHLSFNNHSKFFPEEFNDRYLSKQGNLSHQELSHKQLREWAAKMAAFLDVTSFVQVPDLPELCKRYCKELNLPDDIYYAARNLMAKSRPSMALQKNDTILPNYEGRCMALILFTLKLLYGLDDITEFHLSDYARILNDSNIKLRMFDFRRWLEYIGYRRLVINENHLPTAHLNNSPVDSDLFLQYIMTHNISFECNKKLTKEPRDYKQVLEKLKNAQHDSITFVAYPPSLTPFLEYSEVLSKIYKEKYLTAVLDTTFRTRSMDFLINPNKYLQQLNNNIVKRNGGANENWVLHTIETYRATIGASNKKSNLMPLRIVKEEDPRFFDADTSTSLGEQSKVLLNLDILSRKQFRELYRKTFKRNEKFLNSSVESEFDDSIKINTNSYTEHFQPYEMYWMNIIVNLDKVTVPDFQKFFNRYPNTFKCVFNECARILDESTQEFCQEFILTELYLMYVLNPKTRTDLSKQLNYYISLSKKQW